MNEQELGQTHAVDAAMERAASPAIQRRLLRGALREAREARGRSQADVAQALEWSVSKIIRIEQGSVNVSIVDLKALLLLYGITDERAIERLLNFARGAKRRSWSQYKGVYSKASLELFEQEEAARIILKYEPTYIPGLLQTEEYARKLMERLGSTGEELELKVRARIERQELLDRTVRPELHFVIGEAALSRRVGSARTMRDQFARLLEIADLPGVHLQVLDLDSGPHKKMGGAFTILDFSDPHIGDVVYLENAGGESVYRDDVDLISEYREAFEEIQSLARSPKELAARLGEISNSRYSE